MPKCNRFAPEFSPERRMDGVVSSESGEFSPSAGTFAVRRAYYLHRAGRDRAALATVRTVALSRSGQITIERRHENRILTESSS